MSVAARMAERAGLTAEERADLEDRLHRAIGSLGADADRQPTDSNGMAEFHRLKGKAQGVALALDYLRSYR